MIAPLHPPVTDELPIALRAYVGPTFSDIPEEGRAKGKRSSSVVKASSWTLIFDAETAPDAGQSLRFGTYQFRNGQELDEAGIFYDPDGVTTNELKTLREYAEKNGQMLRTRDDFADNVFFARAYQLRATIVGFNLPFDISRIAIAYGSARTPLDNETGGMRGAFTFKLSRQKIYPNVRVKHMSQKAASISFAAPMRQADSRGQRNRGLQTGIRRGHFIDVKTLANALFARGFSLSNLSKFLDVPNPKLDFDDFAGPVTEEMVRYAVRDAQTTWECYSELIDRFSRLNLSKSIPEKIYSEAGIGKGYIREMGIAPWRTLQSDAPRDVLAKIMGSYFGGRSEVRIRREIRQVILCDFLSMYPTVCTLMRLWRFVIAEGMTWRDSTTETRALIEQSDLGVLQSPSTWEQLATLVRVKPDADIFPVRAAFSEEPQTTIGANFLSADGFLWFTLADCLAAKMLTGKCPEIVEAMSFDPGPVQSNLQPIDIAGNADYRVDPVTADFFKRVIELRQSIKEKMKNAVGDERVRLDTEQNALKICANSTSYGIWIEVNVDTRATRQPTTVHSSICAPFSFRTDKAEMPGAFFHPLLATLITGAARLMLAIAERLVIDQDLNWAFCDTDSMAIAKPAELDGDEFAKRVAVIVDWFAKLNPYDFGGSILKVEDVNSSLATGNAEPLYCLAISSKRYALFNRAPDGKPIMRKVSAHGLGHLLPPYGEDDAPISIPAPDESVLKNGILRWHSDFWYQIVMAEIEGHPDQVRLDRHPALSKPAISRYAATSPELLRWFKKYNASRSYRDHVKPFGFLLSLMEGFASESERIIGKPAKGRRKKAVRLKPIAPFETDFNKAVAMAFDRETSEAISPSALKSYAAALAQYHLSPESKFLNADYCDRGVTARRHVKMTVAHHIGKESHDWERQAMIGLNLDSEITYGLSPADLAVKLQGFVAQFGERMAARALNVSTTSLQALVRGSATKRQVQAVSARFAGAIGQCAKLLRERNAEIETLQTAVRGDGLRRTARKLGIDPSNLRRRLNS